MKNLFDTTSVEEIRTRLAALRPDSPRQWGTMTAPQAVAHCARGLEMAVGDFLPPRLLLGRLIGWIIKPMALGNDEPMRRNTPTVEGMFITDQRVLDAERTRLNGLIDRFVAAGPAGCTTHPHSFFGRLTSQEWAVLMYKHL
ncbi:MAG: DUF1569 domain-containing protein, partial [Gemmatimonadota bacterium]